MSDAEPLSYTYRPRPVGHAVTFRLDDGHLFVDSGRKEERIPYGAIESARLTYQPSNASFRTFRTMIYLKDGRSLRIGNLDWRGFAEAHRQDESYAALVRGLLSRARAANPALVCHAGRPRILWALSAMAGTVAVAGIAGVGAKAAFEGAWAMAGLAAIFLVPVAYQVWAMVTRNRPATFTPPEVPAAVLP